MSAYPQLPSPRGPEVPEVPDRWEATKLMVPAWPVTLNVADGGEELHPAGSETVYE
jgi:hypothetical protein